VFQLKCLRVRPAATARNHPAVVEYFVGLGGHFAGNAGRRTRCPSNPQTGASASSLSAKPTNLVGVMAKKIQRLIAITVTRASKQSLYPDGAGLYLRVSRGGAKSWVLRFMLNGKSREMGLGGFTKVSLANARKKAADARLLLGDGHDPLTHRQEEETRRAAAEKLTAARSMTFDKCAEAYVSAHEASWKNGKHRQQWRSTLTTYVSPVFGSVAVQDVDIDLIMKVIEPLWSVKTETARRVRGRIEVILDWAKVRSYRSGENPARWRGHLDQLLPARSKVRMVKHHAARPYPGISAFMKDLRGMEGTSAAALEFLILTVARTGEVIGARWSEIDLKDRIWVVPAVRMKSGREHRVPLSSAAVAVLNRMSGSKDDYVFAGQTPGAPLSNMALLMLLGRMNCGDITAHGARLPVDVSRLGRRAHQLSQ
jgi:integrase